MTPLHWAVKSGHLDVISDLLAHPEIVAVAKTSLNLTPLMLASKEKRVSVVKKLLECPDVVASMNETDSVRD
ncbi:unnamed protein product [Aphanomyces euteiches]